MDIYSFGGYDWRVLAAENSKALLISEYVLEKRSYDSDQEDITWERCTLRTYLNREFYNSFSSEDRNRIIETVNSNSNNLWYGTPGGNDTRDKIFLLSLEEADKYFGNSGDYLAKRRKFFDPTNQRFYTWDDRWPSLNSLAKTLNSLAKRRKYWDLTNQRFYTSDDGWALVNSLAKRGKYLGRTNHGFYISDDGWALVNSHDSKRVAKNVIGEAYNWWLRSPGVFSYDAANVGHDGYVSVCGTNVIFSNSMGVRPALWVKLDN